MLPKKITWSIFELTNRNLTARTWAEPGSFSAWALSFYFFLVFSVTHPKPPLGHNVTTLLVMFIRQKPLEHLVIDPEGLYRSQCHKQRFRSLSRASTTR